MTNFLPSPFCRPLLDFAGFTAKKGKFICTGHFFPHGMAFLEKKGGTGAGIRFYFPGPIVIHYPVVFLVRWGPLGTEVRKKMLLAPPLCQRHPFPKPPCSCAALKITPIFSNARLFIILFVRNFWRVCSQFWRSVRNSVWGSFNRNSRRNPSLCWLGGGGSRGAKIVNKHFVNKLAFPIFGGGMQPSGAGVLRRGQEEPPHKE